MMTLLKTISQLVVALGLLNVWLLRFNRLTAYRGGEARSMKEEFAVYGLPEALVYVVGALKVLSAVLLIVGIWIPALVTPAAIIVSVLMVGAIGMHVKVSDPVVKSVPAASVLALSLFVCFASL
jgi:hypothetical protein